MLEAFRTWWNAPAEPEPAATLSALQFNLKRRCRGGTHEGRCLRFTAKQAQDLVDQLERVK